MPPQNGGHVLREVNLDMRFKRAGVVSKIVILVLTIYMLIALLNLRAQILSAQNQLNLLSTELESQDIRNKQLTEAIEHQDDPEVLQSVARDKGYVMPDEILYIDVAN